MVGLTRRLYQRDRCRQPGFAASRRIQGSGAPIAFRRDIKARRPFVTLDGINVLDDETLARVRGKFA